MRDKSSKNSGITLIALIITIIVMLILAGVSINAIVGENGILSQAVNAKELTEESALLEEINIILVDAVAQMDNSLATQDEVRDYISGKFTSYDIADYATIQNDETGYVIVYGIYSKNIMYLDSELNNYWTLEAVIGSVDDWYYKVDESTQKALLVGFNYDNLGSDLTIPNVIDGYLVSGLGDQVFMGRTKITSVTFSEGLRTIGAKAFSGCTGLTTISDWPSTLTSIGDEAFYGCTNLSMALTFTDNITSIGASAFYNCSSITGTVSNLLRSGVSYGLNAFSGCSGITGDVTEAMNVLIGDSGTEIPDNLFSGMSGLTGTVTIGSNITRIGEYAFYECTGITKIDITNATNLEEIDDYAFYNCENMEGELEFGENFLIIGSGAFRYCDAITKLILPKNLTSLGMVSFYGCENLKYLIVECGDVQAGSYSSSGNVSSFMSCTNLNSVTFTSNCSMTYIPGCWFKDCTSLASISLPNTVTKIESYAFTGCSSLESVDFSSNLKTIESYCFKNCVALLTLPLSGENLISNLNTISDEAFYNCSILGKTDENETTNIIDLLENSYVTTIGNNAFYGCEYLNGTLADSTIYNTNTVAISQGASCFYGTQVESARTFTLADATEVADSEFQGTTIFVDENKNEVTVIDLSEYDLYSIGDYAFSGCTSITKVIIPYTVTSIGKYAFYNCTALVEVVGYDGDSETEKISGVETLGSYAFSYCTELSELGAFNNVTSIASYTYAYCSSLTNFDFHEGLITIGDYAFYYSGLESIELSSTVSSLTSSCFAYCESLKAFDGSKCESLTTSFNTFLGCKLLSSVSLPDNYNPTGYQTFGGCRALKEIYLPDSVTQILYIMFYNCSSLTTITGGENVTKIGESAFGQCSNLSSLKCGTNITYISTRAFYGCSKLTLSSLENLTWENLTYIGADAFYNCTSLTGSVSLSSDCVLSSSAFTNCPLEYEIGY